MRAGSGPGRGSWEAVLGRTQPQQPGPLKGKHRLRSHRAVGPSQPNPARPPPLLTPAPAPQSPEGRHARPRPAPAHSHPAPAPHLPAPAPHLPRRAPRAGGPCASSLSSSSAAASGPSWTPRGSSRRTPAGGQSVGCTGRGLRKTRTSARPWGDAPLCPPLGPPGACSSGLYHAPRSTALLDGRVQRRETFF